MLRRDRSAAAATARCPLRTGARLDSSGGIERIRIGLDRLNLRAQQLGQRDNRDPDGDVVVRHRVYKNETRRAITSVALADSAIRAGAAASRPAWRAARGIRPAIERPSRRRREPDDGPGVRRRRRRATSVGRRERCRAAGFAAAAAAASLTVLVAQAQEARQRHRRHACGDPLLLRGPSSSEQLLEVLAVDARRDFGYSWRLPEIAAAVPRPDPRRNSPERAGRPPTTCPQATGAARRALPARRASPTSSPEDTLRNMAKSSSAATCSSRTGRGSVRSTQGSSPTSSGSG